MTNQEIFESKKEYNKWLKELSESELKLIIEMLDEARDEGFIAGRKSMSTLYSG